VRGHYFDKAPYIGYIFIGNFLEIGIEKMSHLEQILTSTKFLSKSNSYNFLSKYLGDGLLFSTNQKWFNRRRIITPTFHFKILEQFFEVFVKQSQMLVEQIEKKSMDEEYFDIFPIVGLSILKSLSGRLFKIVINFFKSYFS
jgi:cytochrome P450 family 4